MSKVSSKSSPTRKSSGSTTTKNSKGGSVVKVPQVNKKSSTPTDGTGPRTKK